MIEGGSIRHKGQTIPLDPEDHGALNKEWTDTLFLAETVVGKGSPRHHEQAEEHVEQGRVDT